MKMETLMSRRTAAVALLGGASVVSMGQLAGCSNTPPGGGVQPTVIDAIIGALVPICQVIPIVATLVDIVASVFPAALGVSAITDVVAKQIAQYICGLFHQAGVIHENGKLKGKLEGNFKATVNGVVMPLHGYTVGADGQLSYF